jgi:hypothetical protein
MRAKCGIEQACSAPHFAVRVENVRKHVYGSSGYRLQPGNIPWPGVSTFFGSNLVFADCTAGQTGP